MIAVGWVLVIGLPLAVLVWAMWPRRRVPETLTPQLSAHLYTDLVGCSELLVTVDVTAGGTEFGLVNNSIQHPTASAGERSMNASAEPARPSRFPAAATREPGNNIEAADPAELGAEVTRACMDLAVGGYRGEDLATRISELELTARQWARLGLGLDRLQQAVYAGFRLGFDTGSAPQPTSDEGMESTRRQIDLLESVHIRLTRAYNQLLPAPANSHHAAARNVAVALLRGELAGPLARHCGILISARYHVIAVGMPAPAHRHAPGPPPPIASGIEAVLAERCGPHALSIFGAEGGTLLIPHELLEDAELGELVRALADTIRRPLIAVTVAAEPSGIPEAGRQAHDFLDTASAMCIEPGLYRMSDLGLHFQLSRPGPARDVLHALLEPLDDHPELLQTLATHLANDMNRQRTASKLHVHANTVDYRLKRIHQMTGCDPSTVAGLWRLRSALVVRRYTDRGTAMAVSGNALG
ncbi:helix-turn-helix domain-containing protein [Nocardia cyriacigeorgica]|uniref:PucR family transcriptional regulator n=1 Tax=Nocardia cyriacigeorgica TaxID=135487 RepID=UPI00189403F3|nr:helix-turn-helix domain-containing protein [Nocardia cyriacigeorgica]MBF6319551.1 helix-turn-helix domain-containing protein [Nocardia cyriacigeorgica]MBF6343631.1 helix-turn-helix domain-containing protein [Nocardia cyriacigeorgica]MBF6533665.1 helix-turn-helix domain-containing protein [Nocardia cyriacigeorgica]